MALRKRLWEILELAVGGDRASRIFHAFILTLILLNTLAVVIESVRGIEEQYGHWLRWFDIVSVSIYTVEYGLRIWSCTADPRYHHAITGRIRFALKAMSVIDLLAILPFYIPLIHADLRSLRVLRVLRILRVARLGRYLSSLELITNVLRAKKEELIMTTSLTAHLLVIASTVMYHCENAVQPQAFSSIPATMWWTIATLTTIGYGDMYPVTVLGKTCASFIALLGVGMFALPTGILGAGFVEEIQKTRQTQKRCPHCGEKLP